MLVTLFQGHGVTKEAKILLCPHHEMRTTQPVTIKYDSDTHQSC